MSAVSREEALRLCAEIREENHGKWYSFTGLQCWGCNTFTKGNPDKMCLANKKGCNLINRRHTKQITSGQAQQ